MAANKTDTIVYGEDTPTTPLKRLPVLVNPAGQSVIRRAIQLRLATLGECGSDAPELHGAALAGIVGEWMTAEAERIRTTREGA